MLFHVISDEVTITRGGTGSPDIGHIQWLEVSDHLVDTYPDAHICTFSDGGSHRVAVLYKGLNDDRYINIRLRTYELKDGTLTPTGDSKLMADGYSGHSLTKPRMVTLGDDTVLIAWADIVNHDELEDYIFKGMIYNIKTVELQIDADLHTTAIFVRMRLQ